jgi:hypothetical protein
MEDKLTRTTVFLSGGLGNQLFQIASGLQFESHLLEINISQLHGKFELHQLMDFIAKERGIEIFIKSESTSYIFTKAHNYLLRSSQWKIHPRFQELIGNLLIRSAIYISGVPAGRVYTDFTEFKKIISRNTEVRNYYVIGYFQDENIARSIKQHLTEFLESTHSDENESISIDNSSELTIHIRRGDYASENKIGMLSLKYFTEILSKLYKEQNINRLRLFSNGQFELSSIIDKDKMNSVVEIDATSALELLAKMRNGQIFILSNSTLSWWAAYLCRNPRKIIFVPNPWFRTLPEPVNLIPSDWNKCQSIWSEESEI